MRVAVIEDEAKLAQTLKDGIENEVCPTDIYPDAESFEAAYRADSPYSLLLVDLMLPGKNGFELCQTLRERGSTVPVLVLTARDTVADKVHALDSGADDYLTKPFAFDELLARMRALARRGEREGEAALSLGPVFLDYKTHQVRRGGELVPLTVKEFELLELLMKHANKPVSRGDIYRTLWRSEELGASNVVDVHIRHLREKLHDHDQSLIRTVRGVGYSFAA